MKLPEKIQRERKKMGLSQEKLAEKIGVSRQAITKWENGLASPELEKIVSLSECFKVWCRSSPDRRRKLTILTRIYLEFCSVR